MLTAISAIGILLCMYVLISKKYRTKSMDVTLLFLCFNIAFTCKLWLSLDPTFTFTSVYIFMNYFVFGALCLCIIGVRKTVIIDKRSFSHRIILILKPFYNKIKSVYKKLILRQ